MRKYITFRTLQDKLDNRGRSSIYRDIALGRIPRPIKIGHLNYWDDEAVDATLAKDE
jgi:prophage regulatory protein